MKKRVKQQIKTKSWNHFVTIGFILSFLSWFSILGIVFCVIGLIEIKKLDQKGKILSILGIIIGIIVLILKYYNLFLF